MTDTGQAALANEARAECGDPHRISASASAAQSSAWQWPTQSRPASDTVASLPDHVTQQRVGTTFLISIYASEHRLCAPFGLSPISCAYDAGQDCLSLRLGSCDVG